MGPSTKSPLAPTFTRLAAGSLLCVAACVVGISCSDDGDDNPCNPDSCPDGCCSGDQCLPSSLATCGLGSAACLDCTADGTADTCASGQCVCAATGARCAPGTYCTSNGCGDCPPDCAGKCAGADDGCGGVCVNDDCPDGCCDPAGLCLALSSQTDASCGSGGAACESCVDEPRADTCQGGSCVCAATGALCDAGLYCTASGCGDCAPNCTGKCAGADDDCGSPCPTNDCQDGCCDDDAACVPHASQSASLCGTSGDRCTDCAALGYSCDGALHTCLSTRANAALFVGQSVPLTMTPGQVVDVTVTMRNIGTATWTAGAGYRLGAQNPQDNTRWGVSRVDLDGTDSIAPGSAKTFSFQVTAPAAAGIASFQWRMLQETVEWFGDFSDYAPVSVGTASITVCEAVRALAGTQTDARPGIQTCIDSTPSGGILELPAGVYRVDGQLQIASAPITLRTEGTDPSLPKCALQNHTCAELSASTAFADTGGVLLVTASSTVVDHIVINGNKTTRAATSSGQQCAAYNNIYGHNMRVTGDDVALLNSVSKNSLCGTGCEVAGVRSGFVAWRSTIADNGVHNQEGMWADGVTIHDASFSTVAATEFVDNTDVDLIFGGCQNCIIHNNTIHHTDAVAGGSFAALMIHAWPSTSGNFTGSHTTGNLVDCGGSRRCGFGLLLGSDAWYVTEVFGGHAYRNPVANAQIGVALDDVHDMQVFDNRVTNPASVTDTSCGVRPAFAYSIGSGSYNVDTSRDTLGTVYTNADYNGCIPNWWQ